MEEFGRTSGILLPLFSARHQGDFGVGDFGGLEGLFDWLQMAGQKMLMTLPLLPTTLDGSPYSTRSAFGLNPLLIDLRPVVEEHRIELNQREKEQLELARASTNVRYDLVFPLKLGVLRRAFERFQAGPGPEAFTRFVRDEAEWLDEWALFAAVSDEQGLKAWWEWPQPLAQRQPKAVEEAGRRLAKEVAWHRWLQWVAHQHWAKVRALAKSKGVLLCGDEPFIIGADSADCWCHPTLLRRDARLGAPPDDFSADGQDWGLPWFDFEAIDKADYRWLRFRAAKAASYYDLRRVDHAIGYFRQWIRDDKTPRGRFVPPEEPLAAKLGDRNFQVLSAGAPVVAEDLGVIPRWAREVLERQKIPGYKVMRWAREDGVYQHNHQYPKVSLATTGTHDTETMREWWEKAPQWERDAVARTWPELQGQSTGPEYSPPLHEALLRAALQSSSELCILPWQDVFAERDRVNLPGTVGPSNWSYRMKVRCEELVHREDTARAALWLKQLTQDGGRL